MKKLQTSGRYIRAKTYIHLIKNKLNIKCAGLPSNCYNQVTYDNFKEGLIVFGKLQPERIEGGVVLREREFTIKSKKFTNGIREVKK